jgi:hypothetical protein
VRAERGRTKKLIVAFHFQLSNPAGWKCDECRKNRLEAKRRCGRLAGAKLPQAAQPVWARRNVVAFACPKTLVNGEIAAWLEMFGAGKRFGYADVLRLAADVTRNTGPSVNGLLEGLVQQVRAPGGADGEETRRLAAQLEQLRAVARVQAEAVAQNTQAVVQNTIAQVTTGESRVAEAGKSIWKSLGSGLTLSPLITGLVRLFTRDRTGTPQPLVSYVRPPSVTLEGQIGRTVMPRWAEAITEDRLKPVLRPQITIQVQAMDSRSFLDHSSEIARAVRQAMLNSHSLNDVVNDL